MFHVLSYKQVTPPCRKRRLPDSNGSSNRTAELTRLWNAESEAGPYSVAVGKQTYCTTLLCNSAGSGQSRSAEIFPVNTCQTGTTNEPLWLGTKWCFQCMFSNTVFAVFFGQLYLGHNWRVSIRWISQSCFVFLASKTSQQFHRRFFSFFLLGAHKAVCFSVILLHTTLSAHAPGRL